MEELVSIIALCHNHRRFVVETLDSIIGQSYGNIEIIVISNLLDDGCTDLILQWIESTGASVRFIQNQSPLSISQNINQALGFVNGKYFQVISCDDILSSDKISKQVEAFTKLSDEFACVHSNSVSIDEQSNLISGSLRSDWVKSTYNLKNIPNGDVSKFLGWGAFVSAPSVLLKTDAVKAVGGYNELYLWEDWPMWVSLTKSGFLFFYLDFVAVKIRILNDSISRRRMSVHEKYVIDKMFLDIFFENYSMFTLDSLTRRRFNRKLVSVLNFNFKEWFSFVKRYFGIVGYWRFLEAFKVILVYPICSKLGIEKLIFRIEDKLMRLFFTQKV
jgi:glycosyltransferase involved in cell wall biosynthesis